MSSTTAWKKAREVGKRTYAEVKDFVIEFFGSEHYCLVCNRVLVVDGSASLAAQYFCSSNCYKRSLVEERDCERWEKCLKDGCNRPRYSNEYKFFDYCTRSHAEEHKQWMARFWSKDAPGRGHGGHSSSRVSYTSGSHQIREKGVAQSVDYNGSSAAILFYKRGEPYFEFTNFAQYPIVVDELQYPTSEHYFQSQKLIGTPYVAQICKLPTAREAFEFPRQPHVSRWIRPDWERIKDDVMYRALVAKFRQHRKLQFMLLNTGNRELVEHSPYDSYWGDGPDGKGLNKLGKLLMRVRELLVFIRSHGDHVLHKDHTTVSTTPGSSSQQSGIPCANNPLPDRRHVEADGDITPPADGCGVEPGNDGVCCTCTSIPEHRVGADELKRRPLHTCSSSTPGGQVTSPQPISRSSSTPGDQVGAPPQSVNRSLSTSDCSLSTEANGHTPPQTAQSPDNSLPSLGSSGALANKAGSVTDPSPMDVCQGNDSGAPPDPQKTSEAEQPKHASHGEDEDIVGLQTREKLAKEMDFTLI